MRAIVLSAAATLLLAGQAGAQEPPPPEHEEKLETPPQPPPQGEPRRVARRRTRPLAPNATAATGVLRDTRALRMEEGKATLRVGREERTVRVGDTLGTDVVKAVSPGRLVLHRPSRAGVAGGEALVIVTFGADGSPSEQVFYTENPKPVPPTPER